MLAWLTTTIRLTWPQARRQSPDYFFPSRLHEQLVLEWALEQPGADPVAAYALGNYYYDLKRHEDAIRVWQRAVDDGADFRHRLPQSRHRPLERPPRWRCGARSYYLQALELDHGDPRLVSEYDQLRAKLNDPLADRLAFLEDALRAGPAARRLHGGACRLCTT